jgi:hypothetical protein
MTIDLDALEASIAEGEKKNFFVAPIVKELIAELREARGERPAVAAWLREVADTMDYNGDKCCGRVEDLADAIERGEHRREAS